MRGQRAPGDRWTEHDTSAALALTLYEASLCPGCGHPLAETTSPQADPNHPDRTHHYVVPAPTRCHACTAVERTTPDYDEVPQAAALRFTALRVDDEQPDEAPEEDPAGPAEP